MKFDFIGRKKIWFMISALVIFIGLVALFVKGLNFGIEFKGGTLLDIKFEDYVSVSSARDVLKNFGLEGSIIQPVSATEMVIRMKSLTPDEQGKVISALGDKFKVKDYSVQRVGPGWGVHITNAALIALSLSIAGLLIYTSWRFEFKMAVSAIVALIHDILITVGIYAFMGRVITPNTIAALLTILGYSLYDTIVVFHRVLENVPQKKGTYAQIVNESINQTLIRSINTSLTTLLPVVALLFFGGETLKDFAFVLFIGVASGTYSSIFTASPVLVLWKEKEPKYMALKEKYAKI
ncbi:MAG: protein translocase subunit SecF [Candidatus Subteraquimicrobiales bacterium]|nr:protein translocase subunit SecF [Candidatus Subteraquimicrobiales bacterium]